MQNWLGRVSKGSTCGLLLGNGGKLGIRGNKIHGLGVEGAQGFVTRKPSAPIAATSCSTMPRHRSYARTRTKRAHRERETGLHGRNSRHCQYLLQRLQTVKPLHQGPASRINGTSPRKIKIKIAIRSSAKYQPTSSLTNSFAPHAK